MPFIVLELARRGSLDKLLYSDDRAVKAELYKYKLKLLHDLAKGMHYLHYELDVTMLHRDFKTSQGLVTSTWVGKVADFGTIKAITRQSSAPQAQPFMAAGPRAGSGRRGGRTQTHPLEMRLLQRDSLMTGGGDLVGTLEYMSPEVLAKKRGQSLSLAEGMASDVWSFAVTVWELMHEREPDLLSLYGVPLGGPSMTQYSRLLEEGKTLPNLPQAPCWSTGGGGPRMTTDDTPVWAQHLLLQCLQTDWVRRPSFQYVVKVLATAMADAQEMAGIAQVLVEVGDRPPMMPPMPLEIVVVAAPQQVTRPRRISAS